MAAQRRSGGAEAGSCASGASSVCSRHTPLAACRASRCSPTSASYSQLVLAAIQSKPVTSCLQRCG